MQIRTRWPWPGLDVLVPGSHRPEGMPDEVIVESDPEPLLQRVREANRGGDVHLVGGPRTIETFRALGALDKLLPIFLGAGLRLTPAVSLDAELKLESVQPLPGGSVEIVYDCS